LFTIVGYFIDKYTTNSINSIIVFVYSCSKFNNIKTKKPLPQTRSGFFDEKYDAFGFIKLKA
jgi:hypothetical protein